MMKKLAITVAGVGAMAAAAMGFATAATAATGDRADETVNTLQTQGYNVQLNGSATSPLSSCTVTNVSGASGAVGSGLTAVVDIACPTGC